MFVDVAEDKKPIHLPNIVSVVLYVLQIDKI